MLMLPSQFSGYGGSKELGEIAATLMSNERIALCTAVARKDLVQRYVKRVRQHAVIPDQRHFPFGTKNAQEFGS
jgi:hypothetical protein